MELVTIYIQLFMIVSGDLIVTTKCTINYITNPLKLDSLLGVGRIIPRVRDI